MHWCGLITFESIQFLKNLIEYLCLKYLADLSKWRAELSAWEVLRGLQKKFRMFFSVSFFIYFRIEYTIVLMKGISLRLFSLSKRVAPCSKFDFLDPCPMQGPIKSLSSVCPSAVRHFYKEQFVTSFRFFAPWQINGLFKN